MAPSRYVLPPDLRWRLLRFDMAPGRSYVLLDTATTDTLVLDRSFAHWPCCTSATSLPWYFKFACVGCSGTLRLEWWWTLAWFARYRCRVLRAGIAAHLEHVVDQDAQAADRKKSLMIGAERPSQSLWSVPSSFESPALRVPLFFLPVPCALEAQTVINTSCFDWRFPRKREKVRR